MSSAAAADQPTRIMIAVTPFAVIGVRRNSQVRYGERLRRYSDAVQCSAFARSRTSGGWLTARSSAMEDGGVPRRSIVTVTFLWLP